MSVGGTRRAPSRTWGSASTASDGRTWAVGVKAALQWHVECTTPPSFPIMIATKPAPEVEPFLVQDFSLVLGGPLYQLCGARGWPATRCSCCTVASSCWRCLAGCRCCCCRRGGTRLGRQRHAAVSPRRRTARAPAGRAAVVDRGGTDRPPAHAPGGRPVPGSRPDPGPAARAQFDAAVASAMRLRNSVAAEVLLIAVVYVVGVGFVWRTQVALDVASWYGVPAAADGGRRAAGWWLGAGEPADLPVPARALVFPPVHLGALPLARLAHRSALHADCTRIAAAASAFSAG